jgi:hypothetical protein
MRLENKHQNENLDYRKLSIGIKAGQRRQEFKGPQEFAMKASPENVKKEIHRGSGWINFVANTELERVHFVEQSVELCAGSAIQLWGRASPAPRQCAWVLRDWAEERCLFQSEISRGAFPRFGQFQVHEQVFFYLFLLDRKLCLRRHSFLNLKLPRSFFFSVSVL